jgi:hypothetical protein
MVDRLGFGYFREADSIEAFAEEIAETGGEDVIISFFIKKYLMHELGDEGNPKKLCHAHAVGVYAPLAELKYEHRTGDYFSDPKQFGVSYEIKEFEVVMKIDLMKPLDVHVQSSKLRDSWVELLTSYGIGVFDGGILSASKSLVYSLPLDENLHHIVLACDESGRDSDCYYNKRTGQWEGVLRN